MCVSVSVSENRFFPFSLFFLLICGKKEKKPCVWPQVGWGVALFAVNFLVLGQTGLDFLNARYTNVWKEVVFPSIVFPTSPTNRDRRSDETFALYVEVVCRNSEKTAAVDQETSVRPSRKTQNLWHLPLSCCVFSHDFFIFCTLRVNTRMDEDESCLDSKFSLQPVENKTFFSDPFPLNASMFFFHFFF